MIRDRKKLLSHLVDYFDKKGKILTLREYKQQEDQPHKPHVILSAWGTWSAVIVAAKKRVAEETEKPQAVVRA